MGPFTRLSVMLSERNETTLKLGSGPNKKLCARFNASRRVSSTNDGGMVEYSWFEWRSLVVCVCGVCHKIQSQASSVNTRVLV